MSSANTRRVVITGIGVISALGSNSGELFDAIKSGRSAVQSNDTFAFIEGLKTRLSAPLGYAPDLSHFSHKLLRSAGKVAQYALCATRAALVEARLLDDPFLQSGRVGVAYGSGFGSYDGLRDSAAFINKASLRGVGAGVYHKSMAHTCAAHISIGFGIRGRLLCTSTACTSGSQAVGFGFETIRSGAQDVMLCGGAEELSPAITAMFDVLCACSTKNSNPTYAARPFDKSRDGMVVGEGAATIVVEELERAQRRGAPILAEIVGFSTNSDGFHITNPREATIEVCFREALESASLTADAIGYVNAHATGTSLGDAAESQAMRSVYGANVPVSSVKGQLGHTLGACGAIETVLVIETLRQGYLPKTVNLDMVDPDCEGLDHLTEGRKKDIEYAANNTVAFGGVNTSLILKKM